MSQDDAHSSSVKVAGLWRVPVYALWLLLLIFTYLHVLTAWQTKLPATLYGVRAGIAASALMLAKILLRSRLRRWEDILFRLSFIAAMLVLCVVGSVYGRW